MVNKAVIPAAGLGTRFLPATKAQPKEMMPVVDKPVIQYVVEEAIQSGIDDILIITGRGKRSIEAHFDKSYELEEELKKAGKYDRLETVRNIADLADIHFIRQKERNGLGDAVSYAEKHVGKDPFALLLGDTIIQSQKPCTESLTEKFDGESLVAVEKVSAEDTEKYGIIDPGQRHENGTIAIKDLVEKPLKYEAPSRYAIVGRYVLTSEIFDALRETEPGHSNEVQLTDALKKLDSAEAYIIDGEKYDIGNIPSWLKANTELGNGEIFSPPAPISKQYG